MENYSNRTLLEDDLELTKNTEYNPNTETTVQSFNMLPRQVQDTKTYGDILDKSTPFDRTIAFEGGFTPNKNLRQKFKNRGDGKLTSAYGLTYDDPIVKKYLELSDIVTGISKEKALKIAQERYKLSEKELPTIFPTIKQQPPQVQEVLADLHYNMGLNKLFNFPKFVQAINNHDYSTAAEELKYSDSKTKKKLTPYYKNTGRRAKWNIEVLKNLSEQGYGIKPEIKTTINDKNAKIQQTLSILGYPLKIDGIIGTKTKEAIKKLQKRVGLKADGIIGRKTKAKIQEIFDELQLLNPLKVQEAGASELPFMMPNQVMPGGLVDDMGIYKEAMTITGEEEPIRPEDVILEGGEDTPDIGDVPEGTEDVRGGVSLKDLDKEGQEDVITPEGETLEEVTTPQGRRWVVKNQADKKREKARQDQLDEYMNNLPPEEKERLRKLDESERLKYVTKILKDGKSTMFVGESSQGWDWEQAEGKFQPIWNDKERIEISDKDAKLDVSKLKTNVHGEMIGKLGDAYDHPELYEKYPELKFEMISIQKSLNGSALGRYQPGMGFDIKVGTPEDMEKVVLHEVQHWVQEKENFARGGNQEAFMEQDKAKTLRDALSWMEEIERARKKAPSADRIALENKVTQEYFDKGIGDWLPSREARNLANQPWMKNIGAMEEAKEFIKLYGLDKSTVPKKAHQLYLSLAGEIESRSTANRKNMSLKERQETDPYSDTMKQDGISRDQVIVKHTDGKTSMSENAQEPSEPDASKMTLDEYIKAHGEPVYHGGDKEIKQFKDRPIRGGLGPAYFNNSVDVGNKYALLGGIDNSLDSIEDYQIELERSGIKRTPNLTKAFLDIKNPIDPHEIDNVNDVIDVLGKDYIIKLVENDSSMFEMEESGELENLGYNSIKEYLKDKNNLADYIEEEFSRDDLVMENDTDSLGDVPSAFKFLHISGDLSEYAEVKGIDGFVFDDMESGGTTYVPLSIKQIKTEAQLTADWQAAQKDKKR